MVVVVVVVVVEVWWWVVVVAVVGGGWAAGCFLFLMLAWAVPMLSVFLVLEVCFFCFIRFICLIFC